MKIRIEEDNTGLAPASSRFCAYDDDRYDGSEDSRTRNQIGFGATRLAAVIEFFNRIEEFE